MTSRKTEIQVGLTVLVAIAVLLWGIAWLSALTRSHLQRIWHVRFEQAAGLGEGDEARVNGVRKGVVRSLRLAGDHVVVDLALARDVQLTRDSRVVIRSTSMLGDKVIAVDYRGTGEPWSERDTIPGTFEKGLPEVMADLGLASGGLSGIAQQLDSLARTVNRDGGLVATVENFHRASVELAAAVAENRAALRQTMAEASATAGAAHRLVAGREPELGAALDHFGTAAANLDRLSGRLDSLRVSLQGTASRLERGDGTLGRLVQDERLYDDLSASVRELRALIADIQAHPRKYIRLSVF
jgi:phospholipid/cholesterol/gamma-HCH transport system substrate-binding protein